MVTRGLVVAGIVGGLASGCMLDNRAATRPARFNAGPNMRALDVTAAPGGGGATSLRSTQTPTEPARERLSAASVSMQFTMATAYNTYAGIEAETGRLEREGSNFAGAYGIVGLEHPIGFGSVGVELAGGWRALRFELGDDDEDYLVVEPRVRGQIWFAEQWTLGGAVGARLGSQGEWMAGLYLGVHSRRF